MSERLSAALHTSEPTTIVPHCRRQSDVLTGACVALDEGTVNNLYRTPQTRALCVSLQTTDRKAPWRAVWVDAQMQAAAIVDLPSAADNRNGGAGACA